MMAAISMRYFTLIALFFAVANEISSSKGQPNASKNPATDKENATTITETSTVTESIIKSDVQSTEITTMNVSVSEKMDSTTAMPINTSTGETPNSGDKESGEKSSASPSSIIIAATLTFTIIVVIMYFINVARRCYLENRYANQELLTNDLDFDTSDLKHFEL